MEKEDDLDTVMARLTDQCATYNNQRFHCAIEFKVELLSGSGFRITFYVMFCEWQFHSRFLQIYGELFSFMEKHNKNLVALFY